MRYALLLTCLLITINDIVAQSDDFGIWTFIGVDKKVSKVVTLYGEAEMRTRNDVNTIDCWSLYAEATVRILSFLKGGGGYTFIDYNHPNLSWEPRHRLNLFLIGNYSYGNLNFAIRERYEQVHRMLTDKSQPTPTPKKTLRSRLQCTYKIPNSIFSPYATIELYSILNTPGGPFNDKTRYTAGLQIQANKQLSVSVYYRYVDMINHSSIDSHILGMGCRFGL